MRPWFICWLRCYIQGGPKNWHHYFYALTLPNINRFSKLFHYQNQKKICNNIITKDLTTPQVCRYKQQMFYGPLSGTTRVSRYQKKHSSTHHPDHHPMFISFFHLPQSIASSLFKLRAWQSFCTISFHVLFGVPLGLEPSTSCSIHFYNVKCLKSNN